MVSRLSGRLAALSVVLSFVAVASSAPTLTITNSALYTASSAQAVVNALTPTLAAPPGAASTYKTAFDTWNASGGGQGWTLVAGASLGADTIFNINLYTAYCSGLSGGVEMNMLYTQGAGAPNPATQANVGDPATAFWTQSIVTNDPLGGNTSPYLDISEGVNNGGSTFSPPLYPYQYAGSSFYDKPLRSVTVGGPSKSWTGTAYISKRDTGTKTLTVYDGVTWGFTITPVPEPATMAVLAIGALASVARRRRKS